MKRTLLIFIASKWFSSIKPKSPTAAGTNAGIIVSANSSLVVNKIILVIAVMSCICFSLQAQPRLTYYGTPSGTSGVDNSFFGFSAGLASSPVSTFNSFFGSNAGRFNKTGNYNTAMGGSALFSNATGNYNTAVGYLSLNSNTTGWYNSAIGVLSLVSNTTGNNNSAVGNFALYANTTGNDNTANGSSALASNTTGEYNSAVGYHSLVSNTEGKHNSAVGTFALNSNTTGNYNTANGYSALYYNTIGEYNSAVGSFALNSNTGNYNTANGSSALFSNTTGGYNSAVGIFSLSSTTTGMYNSAVGSQALYANTTGNCNTALGSYAGPSLPDLNNTIAIGCGTVATASDQVRFGNSSTTSIGGQVSWSTLSDGRFKKDIKEDITGLAFINQLRPVSYSIDSKNLDSFLGRTNKGCEQCDDKKSNPRQIGFVAQEVEAIIEKSRYVFHGVEVPQNEKDLYAIRYSEFVIPLVKAVQELSAKAESLAAMAEAQQQKIEEQQQKIDLLLTRIDNNNLDARAPSSENKAALFQNNPNPFSVDTEIKMMLPQTVNHAEIIIYNIQETQVQRITIPDRGETSIKISGNELKAGVYIYTLIVDNNVIDSKRMLLTK